MKPRNKRRGESRAGGFSLLEMLMAISLLLIISAVAFGFYGRYSQRYQVEMEASNLTSAGDRALNRVVSELRMAGYPSAPSASQFSLNLFPSTGVARNGASDNLVATGFNLAGPPAVQLAAGFVAPNINASSVTFEAALGNLGTNTFGVQGPVVDQVQYSLARMSAAVTANCIRNPQYPTGTLWTLSRAMAIKGANGAPGAVSTTAVLDHVFSSSGNAPQIFSYYNATGAVTNVPSQVAEVKVRFTLQTCSADKINNLPAQQSFSGAAYVRNLAK